MNLATKVNEVQFKIVNKSFSLSGKKFNYIKFEFSLLLYECYLVRNH